MLYDRTDAWLGSRSRVSCQRVHFRFSLTLCAIQRFSGLTYGACFPRNMPGVNPPELGYPRRQIALGADDTKE